ncbi:hypothetical protein ACT3T8_15880 [Halomonas sp. AOP1-B1-8]|uniref:hypothetical protein n=1 Tax=Halomonas sp. AOP1-B1-8 TaxID=3457726 RepID=UPI003FD94B6C
MDSYITKPTLNSNELPPVPGRSNKEDTAIKPQRNFIDKITRYIGKILKTRLLLLSSYITRKLYGALSIVHELLTAACKIVCFVVTVFIFYQLFIQDSTDFTAISKSAIAYPVALITYALGSGVLALARLGKEKIDHLISRGLSRC